MLCWIFYGGYHLKVMTLLLQDGSFGFMDIALSVLTYWALFAAAADYATHFNADGGVHRAFYMILGLGIFAMDLQWTGRTVPAQDENAQGAGKFFFCALAFCYVVIGYMHARIMYWIPGARAYCFFHLLGCLLSAMIYLAAAVSDRGTCMLLSWFAVVVYFLKTEGAPPISKDGVVINRKNAAYYVNKKNFVLRTGLLVLLKGTCQGADPGMTGVSNYLVILRGFFIMMEIKIIMFDVYVVKPESHALTVSRRHALLWLSLVPARVISIIYISAGCASVLSWTRSHPGGEAYGFDKHMLANGFAGLMVSTSLQRFLHTTPSSTSFHLEVLAHWMAAIIALTIRGLAWAPARFMDVILVLGAFVIAVDMQDNRSMLLSWRWGDRTPLAPDKDKVNERFVNGP